MPFQKERYPSDWKEISLRIRERAGQKCEFCGVANGAVGARDKDGVWHDEDAIHHMNSDHGRELFGDFPDMIKIVLTVMHLDHDTTNNADDNLKAGCQKCHLSYDAKHHAANAAKTRERKKQERGIVPLFNMELSA